MRCSSVLGFSFCLSRLLASPVRKDLQKKTGVLPLHFTYLPVYGIKQSIIPTEDRFMIEDGKVFFFPNRKCQNYSSRCKILIKSVFCLLHGELTFIQEYAGGISVSAVKVNGAPRQSKISSSKVKYIKQNLPVANSPGFAVEAHSSTTSTMRVEDIPCTVSHPARADVLYERCYNR